jgi:hypothetical protein
MNYPYFIVSWYEGRLPCPPQYRGTVIAKQFNNGQIGGKRLCEKQTECPQEAYNLWAKDRFNRSVIIVERRGGQRRRVRIEELQRMIRER